LKTLYIDCKTGAAGDMLAAALYGLLNATQRGSLHTALESIEGAKCVFADDKSQGVAGKHFNVFVGGIQEHELELDHEHQHEHQHTNFGTITERIASLNLPEVVKRDIGLVYESIIAAESKVHSMPIDKVHLHEVGDIDALADITATLYALELIAPDLIVCSPLVTGFGTVNCAHGVLPVPAPATKAIIEDAGHEILTVVGDIEGELTTPTGAALIRYFVDEFTDEFGENVTSLPKKSVGTGTKKFSRPNVLTVYLSDTSDTGENSDLSDNGAVGSESELTDEVAELSCNLDDMTGEDIAYATETLLKSGAYDVWTTPIYMKKNRPGVMLSVLCALNREKEFAALILKYTTTFGVRIKTERRRVLLRETTDTDTEYGAVAIKIGKGYGFAKQKPEYQSLAEIADISGIPTYRLRTLANEQK
jgi:uncharacterized protein (TIGR00299 family) protein